jgi:hypothetical protein
MIKRYDKKQVLLAAQEPRQDEIVLNEAKATVGDGKDVEPFFYRTLQWILQ